MSEIRKLQENTEKLIQDSQTLELASYSLEEKNVEKIKEKLEKSFLNFFNLDNLENEIFTINFSQEKKENDLQHYYRISVKLFFKKTKSIEEIEYHRIYFLIAFLKENFNFEVINTGMSLKGLEGLFDEIDCKDGLCKVKQNLIEDIIEALENKKFLDKKSIFLKIFPKIDEIKSKLKNVNIEVKTKIDKIIKKEFENAKDINEILYTIAKDIHNGNTSKIEILENLNKISRIKFTTNVFSSIISRTLNHYNNKISKNDKKYLDLSIKNYDKIRRIYYSFNSNDLNKILNYINILFPNLREYPNASIFLAKNRAFIKDLNKNEYYNDDKILTVNIDGQKEKVRTIYKNYVTELFGKYFQIILTENGKTLYIDGNLEPLKINNEIIINVENKIVFLNGKKYNKVSSKYGGYYIDENNNILRIENKIVIEIADKNIEFNGKKYKEIKLGGYGSCLLDKQNNLFRINDGNDNYIVKKIYLGETKKISQKFYKKVNLETIGDCYLDGNNKILKVNNEIVENFCGQNSNINGINYERIELKTSGKFYINENLKVFKVNNQLIYWISDEKKDIFGKKYYSVNSENNIEYLIDEKNKLFKIDNKIVEKIYDKPFKLHGKKYQKIKLEIIGDCFINKKNQILKINNEIVDEIFDRTYIQDGKNYQNIKLKNGTQYYINKNFEIIKVNFIRKIEEQKEKFENLNSIDNIISFLENLIHDISTEFSIYNGKSEIEIIKNLQKEFQENLFDKIYKNKKNIELSIKSYENTEELNDTEKKVNNILIQIDEYLNSKNNSKKIIKLLELIRELGYSIDIYYGEESLDYVNFSHFSKGNLKKIQSVDTKFSTGYYDKEIYKYIYKEYLKNPETKVKLYDLGIREINITNGFRDYSNYETICIDAKYKPSLEEFKEIIGKLEIINKKIKTKKQILKKFNKKNSIKIYFSEKSINLKYFEENEKKISKIIEQIINLDFEDKEVKTLISYFDIEKIIISGNTQDIITENGENILYIKEGNIIHLLKEKYIEKEIS